MKAPEYVQLSRKELQEAEAFLTRGDYHQASGKFWEAAAVMVKAVAENKEWPHESRRELNRTISKLVQETGRRELIRLFSLAGCFHTNFHEGWLTPEQVTDLAIDVRELIRQLDQILEP